MTEGMFPQRIVTDLLFYIIKYDDANCASSSHLDFACFEAFKTITDIETRKEFLKSSEGRSVLIQCKDVMSIYDKEETAILMKHLKNHYEEEF